jgi:transcriptional regulator with XRE-family HTH domain
MNAALSRAEVRSWNQVLGPQSVRDENGVTAARALQRNRGNDLSRYQPNSLQSNAPASRPQHGVEQHPMSLPSDNRTLGERIARALGRRIGYGITRKQLQHALNVSGGTVDNLLSGHQDPSPRVFMALLQFFDAAFAHEILAASGFTVVKLSDVRAAEAIEQYIQSVQALKALEQVRGE